MRSNRRASPVPKRAGYISWASSTQSHVVRRRVLMMHTQPGR
jgi:hypothetical protein